MPLYEYKCEGCGEVFEKIEKFADEPLKVHDKCGGPVHRLMSAPAFQFKGTGWYVTDYAKGGASGSPKGESDKGDGSKADSGKSDGAKGDSGKSEGGKGDSGTSDSSGKNESSNKKDSSSKGASSDKGSSNSSTKTESKPAAGSEKS